jgi:hypothetical protein
MEGEGEGKGAAEGGLNLHQTPLTALPMMMRRTHETFLVSHFDGSLLNAVLVFPQYMYDTTLSVFHVDICWLNRVQCEHPATLFLVPHGHGLVELSQRILL